MSFRRPVRIALILSYAAACAWCGCATEALAQRTPAAGEAAARAQPAALQPPTSEPSAPEPNGKAPTTPPGQAPPGQPSTVPPRTIGPPAVEEVRPEVYYLRNAQGDLEPILGFTYEDFYRLYRLEQKLQQGAKPPAFRFEQATFSGKVENGRAELRAEFRIVASQAGWIRVPLALGSALLADSPNTDSKEDRGDATENAKDSAANGANENASENAGKQSDERMLLLDADEGYVLWLNGAEGQTHSVVLERLLVPVQTNGDESRLRLSLPRSLATADVRFSLPLANAQVKTSDGTTIVATKPAGDGATDVTIAARGGDLQVSWTAGSEDSASPARVVESTAAIRATIDDQAILWEAQLSVRSLKGALESFDVRLPEGAELDPVTPGGYAVSFLGGTPPVVHVALAKPTMDPVPIRLVCRRAREPSKPQETIDFSGFSVVDAGRQSGALVVAIDGDWRIAWGQRAEVREAEQPPESLAPPEDQQAFSFQFYRQPFALVGEVSPQPTRLDVEPQYQVAVEADRLVLSARLAYKVRGAKVSRVQVNIGGWELDDVGPAGMIHASGPVMGDGGALTVPLAQRMRSTFELTLRASRPLPADAKRVDFALPVPTADAVAPPIVVVQTADNVDLMPVEAELSQLAARSGAPPSGMTTEARRHPPLVYRVLDDGRDARFVAERTIRSRETVAESTTDVRIEESQTLVEQQLDLRVAYEPLNRIVLELPAALANRRGLVFSIDGKPVLPIDLISQGDAATAGAAGDDGARAAPSRPSGDRRIALEPPSAIVDRARVTIRHSMAITATEAAAMKIPLAMPVDATVASNIVRVTLPRAATYSSEAPWTRSNPASDAATAATADFRADGRADEITLRVAERPRRTTVHTMWIRTTAAGDLRQDRVAFRVETDERRIRIALPDGAREDRVAAWVDHFAVTPSWDESGPSDGGRLCLQVDLPAAKAPDASPEDSPQSHTIELLYDVAGASSEGGRRTWEAPRVLGDVWQTRTLWEVVIPRSEHVAVDPIGFTPEYAWRWSTAVTWGDTPILPVLGRRPNLSAAELQRLTGASPLPAVSAQVNRYLFGANGAVERIEFRTLPRWSIVLIASGAAIVVGLMLVYAPTARRPAVLVSGCVALLAAAIWSPSTAILAGQAAAAGLLLAVGAGVCSWWFGGRGAITASATPTPSPSARTDLIERGSSASRRRRDDRSPTTTLAAPAEMDVADMNT